MTRILHVLDHSLPLHSGYTFRTRAILRAQMAQGWDVRAITGRRHSAPGPQIETVDGLTFHRTPGARAQGHALIREWKEIGALADAIEMLVRDWRPDIIHAHSPLLNALAAQRVARRHGIPTIYEIRAFWEDAAVGNGTGREGSLRTLLIRWLETRAVRAADAVAVICEGLRGDLVARGIAPDKILVSPNGVDMAMFGAPAPADPALRTALELDGAEVIGFIGSFYDYEGLDDLITALPAIVAQRPQVRLLLVGGGPCEQALRAQAQGSAAAHAIRFVGRVPHEQVERYYGLIDILAYPRKAMRLTELVTPLKPLEAMAQGRLVAASSVGGHRELIEDGVTGTLFPPDDPVAMADALVALFGRRDRWDEQRRAARAFVEAERNWAVNILRYQPVYERLLAPVRRRVGGKMARKAVKRPNSLAVVAMAGLAGAAAMASVPVDMLEWAIASSGLSEIIPAVAPPLSWPVHTALCGLVALLAMAYVVALLPTRGSISREGRTPMATAFSRITDFVRRRVPEPATRPVMPRLRRADAHPDAPPRAPLSVHRELGGSFEGGFGPIEIDAAGPDVPGIPAAASILQNVMPAPLVACDDQSLTQLVDRLEHGLASREQTGRPRLTELLPLVRGAVADAIGASDAVPAPVTTEERVPAPDPAERAGEDAVDSALEAALATLRGMTARAR